MIESGPTHVRQRWVHIAWTTLWLLTMAWTVHAPVRAAEAEPANPPGAIEAVAHLVGGTVYRLEDEAGQLVTQTSLSLVPGDTYIDESDRLYEVVSVDGSYVRVVDQGPAEMPAVTPPRTGWAVAAWHWLTQAGGAKSRGPIGIYHTHNAESYEPTSGEAFEPRGDILQVGEVLKAALEDEGYNVIWTDADHLPHDAQAYLRSRRTAAELSREEPITLIDVHRDAVPDAEGYVTEIDRERTAKVRIVVGRQNPTRTANLEYAKQIKAVADERYPGLIRGIFHASGNYNQDLGSRMILLEFGTHTVDLPASERAARRMAEVIPVAAGLAQGGAGAGSALRTAGWLAALAAAGLGGWAVLNREGFGRFLDAVRALWNNIGGGEGGSGAGEGGGR